jgi:hypothetical protein
MAKTPIAKNRLHASRVDRIAIVDRPAVPDAQIVVYKRHEEKPFDDVVEVIEKGIMNGGFNAGFVIKGTQAAVDALQNEIWDTVYGGSDSPAVAIKEAFADFKEVVLTFLSKLAKKVKAKDEDGPKKLTKEEVSKPFARGLAYTALDSVFQFCRSNLAWLMLGYKNIEDADAVLSEVIDQMEEYVTKCAMEIVANKKQDDNPVFEKAGRIISEARLRKLKEAMSVLNAVVEEAETRYTEKSKKEEDEMDIQELVKQFADLSKQIGEVIKALKEHGMLLNETETKAYNDKISAEKKAQADAVKAEDLKKRAKAVGLPEDSSEADVIGAEKKAEIDAEKVKQDAIEAEKKAKKEAEDRLVKIEKSIANFDKLTSAIEKKFGLKSSQDADVDIDKNEKGDVFGDALKGKKK